MAAARGLWSAARLGSTRRPGRSRAAGAGGESRLLLEQLERENAELREELRAARASAGRQMRDLLVRVLAERSPDLDAHLDGVAELAQATARELGLRDEDVRLIRLAAELHDVGKSAIPDSILNKPGPLDETEWEFMRRHTLIGERIVAAAPALSPVARLVRSSHERLDGDGYPDGLAGEEIPLGARILAVCDAYDAMVSDRSYRRGMPSREALAELRRCSGSQFDPRVVDAFCSLTLSPAAGSRAA